MDQEYAARYVEFEKSHWWFRARREILKALLERGVDWSKVDHVLEIGTGTGANLAALYLEGVTRTGIEPDERAAEIARERGVGTIHTGVVEDAPQLLDEDTYDLIALYDVLEHVEDDAGALRILHRLLNPEGWLVLTVPAYQWMWSHHDEVNLHFRRYQRARLVELAERSGFRVCRATYFNTLLFGPIALIRLLGRFLPRGRTDRSSSDFDLPSAGLNEVLRRLFAFERSLLRRFDLPFGVSLFLLARRPAALS